jgi:hypothetical protein
MNLVHIRFSCSIPQLGRNFLSRVVGASLSSALMSMKSVDVSLTSNELLRHSLSVMDRIDSKYRNQAGLEVFNQDDLLCYALSICNIRGYCDGSTQWINLYRQRIMLCESRVSNIVKTLINTHCSSIIDKKDNDSDNEGNEATLNEDWLTNLTQEIMNLVRSRSPVRALSSDYFDSGRLAPVLYTEEQAVRRHVRPIDFKRVILDYVRRILLLWFGLDSSFLAESRAYYIKCLTSRFGNGCLLLPDVWDIYVRFPLWIFSQTCPRLVDGGTSSLVPFDTNYLEDFRVVVAEFSQNNWTRMQMDSLQKAYLELISDTRSYVSSIVAARTNGNTLKSLLAIHPTPALDIIPHTLSSGYGVDTNPDNDNANLSSSGQIVPCSLSPKSRALAVLVCLLEDAHIASEYIKNNIMPPIDSPRSVTEMYQHSDYLLPLRELAWSRRVVNAKLNPTFAATRAGLFSMQVFRFIHFNSDAFAQHENPKIEFESPASYLEYMETLIAKYPNKPSSFFCNKKAFGQTIKERTWQRYQDYWAVAHSDAFVWPPERAFKTTWKNLNNFKDMSVQLVAHDGGLAQWRGVGKLNLYMLAVDMCAAGLVDPPTVDDVAEVVAALKMGAMQGLVAGSYCVQRCSHLAVRLAFVEFYHNMTDRLTADQTNRFGWSPIVAEHLLCKFVHLLNKEVYKM